MTPPDASSLPMPTVLSIDLDRVEVPPGVVARPVDGLTVLLNSATGRYFSLDTVGARAWALMTSMSSLRAVHDALLEEFDVTSEELQVDFSALVEALEAHGLVKIRHG